MASILKVDTITGVATAGSIAVTGEGNSTTTNLQQGLAKAWVNYTTSSSTSDLDSVNVSSLTDNGTGDTTITYTNAMNTNNYSSVGTCGEQQSSAANRIMSVGTKIAASIRMHAATTSAVDDMQENNVVIHGDLA
tara:strand:+ start:157 stop:561 length:405 start_codon:yes stop_codon:yes gene_type:complete